MQQFVIHLTKNDEFLENNSDNLFCTTCFYKLFQEFR